MNTKLASLLFSAVALSGCTTTGPPVTVEPKDGDLVVMTPKMLEEVDEKARLMSIPNPEYPPELQKAGIVGSAVISFVVGIDGRATDLSVKTTTHPKIGESALEAVRRARFRPAMVDGQPVSARMELPVNVPMR